MGNEVHLAKARRLAVQPFRRFHSKQALIAITDDRKQCVLDPFG